MLALDVTLHYGERTEEGGMKAYRIAVITADGSGQVLLPAGLHWQEAS